MAAGTQSFYDFLHRNSTIEFHPCSLTHDEDVLARIEGLTAINSGLQIDLSGRVNAEAVAGRIVAAPGGLPDFARGARRAPGGRSILAVRSTSKVSSNVVGRLPVDAPVTVAADDIDYVVTEHGTAALRNRSPVERAEALIAIADPLHHAALQRELSTWSSK
jgi:4-hydroxybutyrate CoA-transferase